MTKHEIDIPDGFPEGWEAIAYRHAKYMEKYLLNNRPVTNSFTKTSDPVLIIQPIKLSRIVLEDTGMVRQGVAGEYFEQHGNFIKIPDNETTGLVRIWIVKESK